MIKNILVPCDGSSWSGSALEYATWLGAKLGSTLNGLHVVDNVSLEGSLIHDISGAMGFEPFIDFSSKMRSMLEDSGKTILDSFTESCDKAGLASHHTLSSGVVAGEICEAAKLSDLVVIGRRGVNEAFEYGLMGSVAESVVRRSSKPVLMTPAVFKEPTRPVLAFDGSENASKALHSAAEFSNAFGLRLTVLTVSPEEGEESLKGVEDYLEPYGVDADFVHLKGHPHIEIVKYLEENSSDLVFMGSAHHSRVVGLVLGSTTEYAIRMLEIPFFLER